MLGAREVGGDEVGVRGRAKWAGKLATSGRNIVAEYFLKHRLDGFSYRIWVTLKYMSSLKETFFCTCLILRFRMFKLLGCGVFREQLCHLIVLYDVCFHIDKFRSSTNRSSQRNSTYNLQMHRHSINLETIYSELKQEISRLRQDY